jgi:hypothetical protein
MSLILALLQAAAPAPAPALAPAATPEKADARCLAAFAAMAAGGTAEQQRAAQMGGLFFAGKIVGRNPGADARGLAMAAAQEVGTGLSGELTRCGGELGRVGAALQGRPAAAAITAPAPAPTPRATPTPRR